MSEDKEFEALEFIKEKFAYLEYNCENFHVPKEELDILQNALTELKQIKGKFDEDRKSDITNLSFNKFKEIHKYDTPEIAVDILHRLSLAPDYVKPNSVEVWARRFLRDKVDQALAELKAIKEAKPSEAMKCVERLKQTIAMAENFYDSPYEDEDMFTAVQRDVDTINQALLKTQEQDKRLDDMLIFENGHKMSGFDYKGKQIVAMPLEEYDDFMGQDKVLEVIKDLLGKHCKIELVNGGTYHQIKIKIMGTDYSFGMSVTEEEFDALNKNLPKER